MAGGKRAITIDEVPLEWCLQPAVKLDFRHFADGYMVCAADVEQELSRISHTLSALEIVLVNTSAGTHFGQPDYIGKGCGTLRSAAREATTRRSSGRAIAPDARSATATSRNCAISSRCRLRVSRSPAFR
jgi:hypothetical protein